MLGTTPLAHADADADADGLSNTFVAFGPLKKSLLCKKMVLRKTAPPLHIYIHTYIDR